MMEMGGQEEPSSKRSRHAENVLRRIALVERRLVEVEVGGERFHHLDNIMDVDNINAWEAEDAEKMDFSIPVDEIELL